MDFVVKQINYCFPYCWYFQKTTFGVKNCEKNCDSLLIFEFYVNIYAWIRLEKFIAEIPWFILMVSESQKDLFLKFHWPKNEQNIRQNSALESTKWLIKKIKTLYYVE